MNYLTDKILRGTHRLYVNHYGSYLKPIDSIMDPEKASNIIYQQLKSDSPSMVARYGSTEIFIIRKSKFPWFPERSVQFSGKRTKRSVQKKRLHTTLIKPEQKVNEDLCSGFIVS